MMNLNNFKAKQKTKRKRRKYMIQKIRLVANLSNKLINLKLVMQRINLIKNLFRKNLNRNFCRNLESD